MSSPDTLTDFQGSLQNAELEEPGLREKFRLLHLDLLNMAEEWSDKIPSWVPIVQPLLQSKIEEQKGVHALSYGVDPETGAELATVMERLKVFGHHELRMLLEQGKGALDAVLLFGSGGASSAAETPIKGFTMDKLVNVLNKLNGESAADIFVGMIPDSVRGLMPLLKDNAKAAEALQEITRFLDIITQNEMCKKGMTEWLEKQEWWQSFKQLIADANSRNSEAQKMMQNYQPVLATMGA